MSAHVATASFTFLEVEDRDNFVTWEDLCTEVEIYTGRHTEAFVSLLQARRIQTDTKALCSNLMYKSVRATTAYAIQYSC